MVYSFGQIGYSPEKRSQEIVMANKFDFSTIGVEETPENNNFDFSTIGTLERQSAHEQNSHFVNSLKPIDAMPEVKDVYDENNAWIGQHYSEEQIQAWKNKGSIGAIEAFNKMNKYDVIPFSGGFNEAYRKGKIAFLANKASSGENLTLEEKQLVSNYMADEAEIQTRGYSLGGNAVGWGIPSLTFTAEFIGSAALALALQGEFGATAVAGQAAKIGARKAATEAIKKMTTKEFAKQIPGIVAKQAVKSLPVVLPEASRNTGNRFLNNGIAITDKGEIIAKKAEESPAITVLKALGDTYIDYGTEFAGAAFAPVVGAVGKTGGKLLPKILVNKMDELALSTGGKAVSKMLKTGDKLGFHGFLEEHGEELLANVIKTTFDLDPEEGYSFDQFGKAINPGWENFIITSGLIALQGTASYATVRFANHLALKGFSEPEIDEAIQHTSELEKEVIVNKFNELEKTAAEKQILAEEQAIREEIETDFYNKALNAGMKEDEALSASQIVSARAKVMADRYGEDAKKWYDSFTLQGDKQTYDPAKDNSEVEIYFQSAETAGVEKVAKAKEVFNTETTGMSFYDALLDEKQAEYYAKNKKAVGEVLYISPDNYIDFAAKGNWEEYGREGTFENFRENTIAQKQTDFGKENIQKLKKIVEEGGKIDMPVLEYYQDGHFRSQEGYHRALMAKELGVEMIPVLVVNAPEQIKSVNNQGTFSSDTGNIYYQSSLPEATIDWTDKFDKIPTFEEIKSYINELVEKGTKFKTLSSDWNIDIKGGQRVKNKLINTGNYKKLSRAERERHNKYITGITELINNSKYSHSAKNNKTGKKPNVEKYHYFTANVKIGDKVYKIVLDTEQYKKESEKKPQTVHLYNITEHKTSSSGVYAKRILKEPSEDVNNNITYNQADFNPKGQIEISDQKKIITLFKNADASTIIHEMGHLFLNDIITSAETNEQAKADLEAINKWLGYNGEEYTREQHEKFAKGFEAYVMSGKAPTSMLKRAFENFKAWLKDIYNSVQDLGVEMSPETEELFRKLFTPSEAALNEERKQYKQLVGKAKEFGNKNSDSKLKSEVKGIIQELFRSILSTETGKNYDLKAAASAWAKGKKNDKFAKEVGNWGTAHDYNDLAQSIFHNDYSQQARDFLMGELFIEENRSDFNSAEFASNVLNLYSIEAWDYISNTDNVTQYADLDGIEKQYAYILNSYKNSANRNIEQMAFYDWLESIDGVFRDDFDEQWITETNNIERFEKLDKFEQAKEIILQNVNKLVTYDGRQEYENIIRETFGGLNFLTAKDKQKLLNNILSMRTVEELKNNIDDIIDISKTLDDIAQRRVLADKIYKVVVETKPFIKQGNKKVGKYDLKTNDFIQELKELNRLSKEDAREELYKIDIDVENIENNPLSFEEKLRLKFLNFKSDFVINHSSDFLSSLYEDLLQLKIAGKLSKDEIEAEKRLNKRVRMEELLNILGKKKEAKTAVKSYIPLLGNWESAINAIFNKNMRDVYSLLDLEAVVQNWAWKEKQKLNEKIALSYGIKNHEVDGKIIDNLAEKYTVYEFMEGERLHQRELNKMNIIEAYIWNKNEVLRERLLNQFGGEVGLNELFRNLSDEDIKFADAMQRTANSYYAVVNRVFIKKYGIELPKVQNYFPSVTERVSEVDLLNDYVMRSTSPSFIKGRSGNTELLMKFSNPMQLLYGHIDKTSRFVHMTETLDMYNQVFKTPIMNRAISAKYGEDTYKSLVQMLANSSYAKKGADYDGWAKPLNDLVNNWTVTKIGVKPAIAIKQLLSTVNYASEMPVSDWTKGFIKALLHPKKTIEFMKQDEYLKTRFESGGQAEFLEETINNSQFAKTKKLKDMITLNVRLGDIGAICFGGKPYIDHFISTGMTKEEAFKQFRLATMRSMQASVPSSLSNFQNNFKNPIVRAFNAFRNTSYQYARKMGDAIISYSNGDISKTQMAKELFIYGCLNSFMYRTATSLAFIRLLMTGDDDDLKADFIQSIFDLNATVIPYFGEAYLYALARLTGQRGYEPKVPVLDDIIDTVKEFFTDDVGFEDFMNAITVMAELGAGVPAKSIENMAAGLFDTVGGEPEKGVLRTLGYSEYTAEKAIGDE